MTEQLRVTINGETHDVTVVSVSRNRARFVVGERNYEVEFEQRAPSSDGKEISSRSAKSNGRSAPVQATADGHTLITSPIPGVVLEVIVSEGDSVSDGDILLRIEAMKMENNIFAPHSGTVEKIYVGAGVEVGDHAALIEIKA